MQQYHLSVSSLVTDTSNNSDGHTPTSGTNNVIKSRRELQEQEEQDK